MSARDSRARFGDNTLYSRFTPVAGRLNSELTVVKFKVRLALHRSTRITSTHNDVSPTLVPNFDPLRPLHK